MPMPGTPRIVTSCGDRSDAAHSSRSWSKASSRSRPTNGVRWRERSTPGRASGRIASQTLIASLVPATAIGAASRYSIASLVRRNVGLVDENPVHGGGVPQAGGRLDDLADGNRLPLGRERRRA